ASPTPRPARRTAPDRRRCVRAAGGEPPGRRRQRQPVPERGCVCGRPAAPREAGDAHHRHRHPCLRAVVRGQRSDQRQGVRVRGGVRRRRAARLRRGPGGVGGRPFQQLLQARAEELRLRHQPDLDHPGAREGRGLLRGLLLRGAGRHRPRRLPGRRRHLGRGPGRVQARRPDRHHEPHRDPRRHPAGRGPARVHRHQCSEAGPAERAGRRDPRRRADRLLHHRGRDPGLVDRRAVPARDRSAGAVRHVVRAGQRLGAVRQRGARRTDRRRHAGVDREAVALRRGGRPGPRL
ncbi:MAG: ABC transporter, substrate-binding protein (cluster 3, basic aa/glutamine/opines), partial [uncultured Nocardioidaceae bacterium]